MALKDLIIPGSKTFVPSSARKVAQRGPFTNEKHTEYSWSPYAGHLRLTTHEAPLSGRSYQTGEFLDYRGIVSVASDDSYLRLDAAAGGRIHSRSWRHGFSRRMIMKLCREFLTDLHGAPV